MNNPECTIDRKRTSMVYLYGVIEAPLELHGTWFLESGREIRAISHEGLAALTCPADSAMEDVAREPQAQDGPPASPGPQALEAMLQSHEEVLEEIERNYGTVLPARFGILIKGEEELRAWLVENRESLFKKLGHIKDRKEYCIKIYLDYKALGSFVVTHDPELKKLEEETRSQSPGRAYLSRQKLQTMLKARIERTCDELFRDYHQKISRVVQDLAVKKVAAGHQSRPMLMNLSVLADDTSRTRLGEVLDEIKAGAAGDVAFTGPWLPFSFA